MFGKSQYIIETQQELNSICKMIEEWRKDHNLNLVKSSEGFKKFRFGSPFLSNPIYIEIDISKSPIIVHGWVQTLIPFFTWKLIETKNDNLASKLDYRRKGGYFCHQLIDTIT